MNLSDLIAKAKLVFVCVAALVPLAEQTIQTVENAFPAGSPGAVKLEAVKNMLSAMWASVSGAADVFEQAWPTIAAFVSALVAIYNATGLFKKGGGATTA